MILPLPPVTVGFCHIHTITGALPGPARKSPLRGNGAAPDLLRTAAALRCSMYSHLSAHHSPSSLRYRWVLPYPHNHGGAARSGPEVALAGERRRAGPSSHGCCASMLHVFASQRASFSLLPPLPLGFAISTQSRRRCPVRPGGRPCGGTAPRRTFFARLLRFDAPCIRISARIRQLETLRLPQFKRMRPCFSKAIKKRPPGYPRRTGVFLVEAAGVDLARARSLGPRGSCVPSAPSGPGLGPLRGFLPPGAKQFAP